MGAAEFCADPARWQRHVTRRRSRRFSNAAMISLIREAMATSTRVRERQGIAGSMTR